jgi:hypothetical protein
MSGSDFRTILDFECYAEVAQLLFRRRVTRLAAGGGIGYTHGSPLCFRAPLVRGAQTGGTARGQMLGLKARCSRDLPGFGKNLKVVQLYVANPEGPDD